MYHQALPINRRILLIDDDRDVHEQFRAILNVPAEPDINQLTPSPKQFDTDDNTGQDGDRFLVDSEYQGDTGYQRVLEEEIAGSPYALAFIDDNMPPGLDGIETVRKIWADSPDLEIVLLLTNTEYSYEHIIGALGTSEQLYVVRKPLDPLEIKQLTTLLTRKWSFKHDMRQSMQVIRDEYVCRVRELESAGKALQAELISSRREKATLQEELTWHQLMYNNAGDTVMVHTVDSRGATGKFIDINDCACRQFGYSRDEFLKLHPSDILRMTDANDLTKLYKQVYKHCEIVCECLGVNHDGKNMPIEICCRRFEHQGKTMVMTIARDVIERLQIGVSQTGMDFLDRAIEKADDIMYTLSPEGVLTSLSPSFEKITGWTREEWVGKSFASIIHPDDLKEVKNRFELILNGLWAPLHEIRILKKSGEHIYIEVISTPHIHDGRIIGLLGTARDITERKKTERKVESLARFPAENPSPIFRIDGNGILLYANNAAETIMTTFGFEPGMSVLSEWGNFIARTRNEDKPLETEITCREKIYSLLFVPVKGVDYINVYGVDVTAHRHAEVQKLEMEKQLERAERMESLAVLAGGVAHDLNNILGPLVGYPDLILQKLPPDHPSVKIVEMLGRSARDAADVIQDLLTLARRGRMEFSPVNLNGVVQAFLDSATFHELTSNHPDLNLAINLDPDPAGISGSAHHLSKVVMNLVINAVDAMPEGGVLTVETRHDCLDRLPSGYADINPGEYQIVSVRDTGIGIAREETHKIFEPYYSKKKMGASGSGLGLAIVYGIVRDHHGYYDICSEPGKGTEFSLYFPVTDMPAKMAVNTTGDIGGNESILVIDDNPDQRALANRLLSNLGYAVCDAVNGPEALMLLAEHPVDLVVLNMSFEMGSDGLDIFRQIRDLVPDQKTVIVSDHTIDDRIRELQKLGAGAFVRKPFTQQTLGRAIRAELSPPPTVIANQPPALQ